MTCNQLIALAKTAKIGIGRRTSNVYYWVASDGQAVTESEFRGTWPAFVRFIKTKVAERLEVAPAPRITLSQADALFEKAAPTLEAATDDQIVSLLTHARTGDYSPYVLMMLEVEAVHRGIGA